MGNTHDFKDIGPALRSLQERHGLDSKQAARRVGIPTGQWLSYVNGVTRPGTKMLDKIAAAFKVSLRFRFSDSWEW